MEEKIIHHEFSPSRLPVLENCPYSYKNCLNWERTDGKDALAGRKLHEAVYNDNIFNTLSEKDKNMILSIREEHIYPYRNAIILNEVFVEVKDENEIITSGWADLVVLNKSKTVASLKDFKFGGYEVEGAENNIQLLTYAVGLMQKYESLQKVYVFVVQPLFNLADYSAQVFVERKDIPEILQRIKNIIHKAKNATEKDAVCSSENCRYCNKERCSGYRKTMQKNFYLLSLDCDSLPATTKEMTVDFADKVLLAANEIKKLLESKENEAKKVVLNCGGSEHFRIASGRKTTRVNWDAVCEKFNITEKDIEEFTETKIGEPYISLKTKKQKKEIKE
jgi:hypothetical protein